MNPKNIRRRLRLWTDRMRGMDIETFSPHGVPIDLPLFSGPFVSRACSPFVCHHSAA